MSKYNRKQICLIFILLIGMVSVNSQTLFDLDLSAKKSTIKSEFRMSDVFGKTSLILKAVPNANEFHLVSKDSVDWSDANYIVCEIYHENAYSLLFDLCFYRKGQPFYSGAITKQGEEVVSGNDTNPWLKTAIGVLPKLKTQVIFPLQYLDAQQIFMQRFPRQLKGTVTGRRLAKEDIAAISIKLLPVMIPHFCPEVTIASAYLCKDLPISYPSPEKKVVDEFGQWTGRDWIGKVKSETQLKQVMKSTEDIALRAKFPTEWSRYGGYKAIRFQAKGFFYVHNDGKRWWFVDPDGFAFLSAGVTCINAGSVGSLTSQQDLFSWLPPKEGKFSAMYSQRNSQEMVDFQKGNMIRVYGDSWYAQWKQITAGLMKEWGVNTVANWSDVEFAQEQKMPYMLNLQNFPSTKILLFRDFPDVYDPAYKENSKEFAKQLETIKNDPYLVGYFLQNEPHWAFGENNIAFEMFATNQVSYSKIEMINCLKNKYVTVENLNKAWDLNLSSITGLLMKTFKDVPSKTALTDFWDFSGVMVDEYVKVVCDEVKRVDNNHLNLGMRYAWISSELCYRAGAYFDVFSVNGYSSPEPPATEEIALRSGKPILIGEWHFGSATDRGLPATGIQGALNQKDRGNAYRYYFENGFARPEVIGLHWFQWNDQLITGRHDGENYNIGFMDICMQPYPELTKAAKISHQRMYRIATGKVKPYSIVPGKAPQIYY